MTDSEYIVFHSPTDNEIRRIVAKVMAECPDGAPLKRIEDALGAETGYVNETRFTDAQALADPALKGLRAHAYRIKGDTVYAG